jgi:UDP-N-acetylglucosamine--N-acetylmuramyl-(pentapeptide) pyrophosphoryl-undecaprenol N-acetylglucosamine transferase
VSRDLSTRRDGPVRVVIAGGGTAGHIEPALAFADAVRRLDPTAEITALGTAKGLESSLIPPRGYDLELIPPAPLPRAINLALLRTPGRLAASVKATGAVLDRVDADVVVGFGGYVALPAYLAARRRRRPIVVHESNAKPGLANRLAARLTRHVFTASAAIKLPHATAIGTPLRLAISTLDRSAERESARAGYGLRTDAVTLLVTGGSQGAKTLNDATAGAADVLRENGIQVLHVYGSKNNVVVADRPDQPPYVAVPYVADMDRAYAAADFVLCRCGAMTCAELTAVGLPAAYVPYPFGNGEQRFNAEPIVAAGGGLLVDNADLTPGWIIDTVMPILTDPQRLDRMASAAAGAGARDADVTLARAALAVARTRADQAND